MFEIMTPGNFVVIPSSPVARSYIASDSRFWLFLYHLPILPSQWFDDPRHMILLSDSSYVPIFLFFYKTDFFNLGIHLMAYVQNNNH